MKVSEMIAELKKILSREGDIPVKMAVYGKVDVPDLSCPWVTRKEEVEKGREHVREVSLGMGPSGYEVVIRKTGG